ncbi:MAG: TetR/AcrR family transcriptional regulator [Clostridia bacterium]|nr:TetR/AcrR family transcriptional regulator [Clostridia bacterium]MBR3681729.1 TetR/AcrR family transcriptional regulator [Clostridia bacterium]
MKEDLRVQKTKAALFRAFYALLAEKSYESITVNELCERAMVRRATFYKHYKDKQDFLIGLVSKFREQFCKMIVADNASITLSDYFSKYISNIIGHVLLHPEIVKNILQSQMREPFINVVIQNNFRDAVERITEARNNGESIPVSTEVAASMIVGGGSLLVVEWFENGMKLPREQLELDVALTINRILSGQKV